MKPTLITVALLAVAFCVPAQTVEVVQGPPGDGEDFVVRVSGVWRDSCVPEQATVFVTGNWIIPTFTLRDGVCLAAPTPYTADAVIPGRAGHPAYQIFARVLDFDGHVLPLGETTVEIRSTQSGPALGLYPDFAPANYRTLVRINGMFTCDTNCSSARVWLGENELEQVRVESDSLIVGYTPLGTSPDEVVDVVVQRGSQEWRRAGGFRFLAAGEFERVLVPIWFLGEIAGAHGSVWTSSFLLYNGHDVTLLPGADILSIDTTCHILCPLPVVAPNTEVQPMLAVDRDSATPAAMLYIHRTLASQISFGARTRDLSRQSETWGTEIPVIRDAEIAPYATARLLDVPTEDGFRVMLRLYSLNGSGTMTVRVFDKESGETLIEEFVPLVSAPGGLDWLSSLPTQPGYAQIPDLQDRPELDGVDRVRIELYGSSGISWGMASITHEDSQHVTLITPQ